MEQEKKEHKPLIPSLGGLGKPSLKFKGFSSGLSFLERLKQFKKKDLAFILSGLGVLFMAPLAEHLMMGPSEDTGAFKEGWGFRDGAGSFGKGGSPFEPGMGGMAPGGLAGGGSDVITPLNVRDPSALVMGPGATQQPPAATIQPPPSKPETDWKDALANAASKAGSEATKRGGLPVPPTKLGGSGLRGLGAIAGGSGANLGAAPLSAANVPNKPGARGSGLENVVKDSHFKGVARGQNTGAGGLEQLKAAASKAGTDFNRGGSAATNLETAASRGMPGGGSDGGAGQGSSKDDKNTAGNSSKDSKSTGESLDFLRRKEEQQKAIDLKWKLREKEAMRWPNLYDKMLEKIVMAPIEGLADMIKKSLTEFGSESAGKMVCWGDPVNKKDMIILDKDLGRCGDAKQGEAKPCIIPGTKPPIVKYPTGGGSSKEFSGCTPEWTGSGSTDDTGRDNVGNLGPGAPGRAWAVFRGICDAYQNTLRELEGRSSPEIDANRNGRIKLRDAMLKVLSANHAMAGGASNPSCGGVPAPRIPVGDTDSNIHRVLVGSDELLRRKQLAPKPEPKYDAGNSVAVLAGTPRNIDAAMSLLLDGRAATPAPAGGSPGAAVPSVKTIVDDAGKAVEAWITAAKANPNADKAAVNAAIAKVISTYDPQPVKQLLIDGAVPTPVLDFNKAAIEPRHRAARGALDEIKKDFDGGGSTLITNIKTVVDTLPTPAAKAEVTRHIALIEAQIKETAGRYAKLEAVYKSQTDALASLESKKATVHSNWENAGAVLGASGGGTLGELKTQMETTFNTEIVAKISATPPPTVAKFSTPVGTVLNTVQTRATTVRTNARTHINDVQGVATPLDTAMKDYEAYARPTQ